MRRVILLAFLFAFLVCSCSNPEKSVKASTLSLKKVQVDSAELDVSDCVFDTSTYKFTTQALRKYKENVQFTWDNIDKEAKAVLDDGDTLFLHIGGCDHFSYSATLLTGIPFADTTALIEKSRWLAKTFFADGFDSKYDDYISRGLFKNQDVFEKNSKAYEIIAPDTTEVNFVFGGFEFRKRANKTRIDISGYIN